jgi:monothiol glutaredoxin
MNQQVLDRIKQTITGNPIVLYMKGTPEMPQCGFSNRAVQILKQCGVEKFVSVDVLSDSEVRENLKLYADFPTFPQLYINGELIGGSDIMLEMFRQGELQELIGRVKEN